MDMDDDEESSNSSQPSMLSQPQVVQRVTMVAPQSATPTPTTLMLVTSNAPGSVGGQTAVAVRQGPGTLGQSGTPTITVRPTANGIGGAGGLVVLSGTSVSGATPVHSVSTPTQGGLPTTLAVRTTTSANPNSSKTHTILVMPVSSSGAGDVTAAKRVKTE